MKIRVKIAKHSINVDMHRNIFLSKIKKLYQKLSMELKKKHALLRLIACSFFMNFLT